MYNTVAITAVAYIAVYINIIIALLTIYTALIVSSINYVYKLVLIHYCWRLGYNHRHVASAAAVTLAPSCDNILKNYQNTTQKC